jgi:hypothetical protein
MSKLSTEVKNFVQNARGLDNARVAANEWFKTVGKSNGDKSIQSYSGPFKPGKIYVFRYEHPVTEEKLETWDANPVVLSLGRVDGLDVGINLNYLPQKAKLALLDKIYSNYGSKIEEAEAKNPGVAKSQKDILSMNQVQLERFVGNMGINYAIKRYVTNLRKSSKVVSAEGWKYLPLLNLSQFKPGGNVRKVESGYSKYINKKKK